MFHAGVDGARHVIEQRIIHSVLCARRVTCIRHHSSIIDVHVCIKCILTVKDFKNNYPALLLLFNLILFYFLFSFDVAFNPCRFHLSVRPQSIYLIHSLL